MTPSTALVRDRTIHNFQNYNSYINVNSIKYKAFGLYSLYNLSFSSLECFYVLYFTLVRPRLEYASVVWNSITSTDANKFELIQQKFTSVCIIGGFLMFHIHTLLP
jgi:hypothetical protein